MALTDYERYLRIPELLALQKPAERMSCHDELLFQVVHQVEELWMKLILHETGDAIARMDRDDLAGALATFRRIHEAQRLMSDQLQLIETLSPRAYFTIRKGLGHGSGQESPGFNAMLGTAGSIWASYAALLARHATTVHAIQMAPDAPGPPAGPAAHRPLYELAEALIDYDERFQRFRYDHLKLVQRVIGGGTASLKGIPAEVLERSLRHRFFPELWDARERVFAEFVPGPVDP